ncbi:MAG: hypothetical protein R2730_16695 [Chitinophagales bacterium]
MSVLNDWRIIVLLCLTLGLAPFQPEPHILGKIRWILGGANGMQAMDWFDFFLHGTPWFLLIAFGIKKLLEQFRQPSTL